MCIKPQGLRQIDEAIMENSENIKEEGGIGETIKVMSAGTQ